MNDNRKNEIFGQDKKKGLQINEIEEVLLSWMDKED